MYIKYKKDGIDVIAKTPIGVSVEQAIKAMSLVDYELLTDEEAAEFFKLPTPTLADHQDKKWEEIKAIRDHREQAGLPYMGKTLDSDPVSVQRITVAVQAAQAAISVGQDFTIDWTCQDNSVLTMTAQEVMGIPAALAIYSNELHQKARGLREQIEAATTPEELDEISW